jgi:uncharacterized SAM-binding protein YcdF (DUF218 family)
MQRNIKKRHFTSGFLQRQYRLLKKTVIGLCFLLILWLLLNVITLRAASSKPTDAFFVLGGSIRREIYVAELSKKHPSLPVVISSGSVDPCILLIFQKQAAGLENVWLEKCADSTFGNFYYSIPLLKRLRVHKVKMITSLTHTPRAEWIAKILFGAQGIWVDVDTISEKGVPGNRENLFKTSFDVSRSLLWAIISQIIEPQCDNVTKLVDVDMAVWQEKGFKCERQFYTGE